MATAHGAERERPGGAPLAVPGLRDDQPITVTSHTLEYDYKRNVVVYRGGDAWWGGIFALLSEGVGLGFAAMSVIGAGFAAAWVASAVYLGRVFERRERQRAPEPHEAARLAGRPTVAEQRT